MRALLADPAAQGLSDAAASWGDPSPEAAQAYAGACAELLERLFEIDRSALGEGEQLAYDVLQRYWEQTVAAASCAMYEEPFAPETGAQVWLPQALRLMREVERRARLEVTGLAVNANLGAETGVEELRAGREFIESLSQKSGLPVAFEAGPAQALCALPERWPRLCVRRYLAPEWMD